MPLSSGIETTQFKKVSALLRRKFRRSPWQQYSVMTSTGPEWETKIKEFQNTQKYSVALHTKVQGPKVQICCLGQLNCQQSWPFLTSPMFFTQLTTVLFCSSSLPSNHRPSYLDIWPLLALLLYCLLAHLLAFLFSLFLTYFLFSFLIYFLTQFFFNLLT